MRSRHRFFLAAAVTALLIGFGSSAAAQSTITGRVMDVQSGQPINLAEVSVGSASVLTNNQGSFSVRVAPGRYTVSVRVPGYQDGVEVVGVDEGASVSVEIRLEPTALALNPITVTATRQQSERTLSAPAAVNIAEAADIEVRATTTVVDHLKEMEGVDVVQTGINQSNTVTRGFNNVFSGALLVLTDNRYARVPSLRVNAYNMIPANDLDLERVELVLGPASALYGPNSANGVMHLITSSPIDKPGTSISLMGGSRSIFNGAFRQAFRFNEKVGLKVSGSYFTGDDFEFVDLAEQAAADPSNPRIGARIFDAEKWGTEARLDVRPWEGSNDGVTVTYGRNMLINSVELTGIGAGQARDWKYEFGQVQFRRAGFYMQGFVNRSDAGETYLLRTGSSLIDESNVFSTQAQYAFQPADRLSLVVGSDLIKTVPKTGGTINGANEDDDETLEIGGYVSATTTLTDRLDLIGALRVDNHEHLEDPVWSPRLGLVFEPVDGQVFRGTFNRAFSTPSQNNLFLDLTAGRIELGGGFGYRVQTTGVPSTGYTWDQTCAGGVMSYCMYSPFAPGTQLPATGSALWDGVLVPLALMDPAFQQTLQAIGMTPQEFATAVGNPGQGDLTSYLARFNSEDTSNPFLPDPGVTAVRAILPTITTTYEVGYQGLIADRLKLSASVYRNQIRDFVGPLRVETPTVFLDGTSVATYVATRLIGAGVPAGTAQAIGAGLAADAAMIPLGTVAPDQRANSDIILTYRNFGDVDLWGADVGLEAYATDDLAISASYSWVSDECFDFNSDGNCSSSADIALNAPSSKGSLGVRYDDRGTGMVFGVRVRYSAEFPMNSGVYVGTVDSYAVVDANVAYRVPGYQGFIVSATVNNLFDNEHQEFVGAPAMGRIALVKVQYAFGN
jgi:iron complex outermembrane receptor protein